MLPSPIYIPQNRLFSTSAAFIRPALKLTSMAMISCALLQSVQAAPIHDAVLANDAEAVANLIEQGADINELDELGFSALLLARIEDHDEIAATLREAGAQDQISELTEHVQLRLWGLGYLEAQPDGILGENTRGAIRDYQADVGMEQTGRIRPDLVESLDQSLLKRLQNQLTKLNLYNGEIDGITGPQTRAAIAAGQEQYGFDSNEPYSLAFIEALARASEEYPIRPPTINERINAPSEDEIDDVNEAPADETINLTIVTPDDMDENTVYSAEELELSDELIKDAQSKLTWLGFDTKGTDGLVGPGTRAAIVNFAQTSGLTPGPSLNDALLDELNYAVVARVQTYLNELEYDAGPADGLKGSRTVAAMNAFQEDQSLTQTEDISDTFLNTLSEAIEQSNSDVDQSLDKVVIINIQQKLNWLGYDTRGIDGVMGSGTEAAIKQFADSVDIDDADLLDDALIGALDNQVAKRVQQTLNDLDYKAGPVDGLIGSETKSAIREFETDAGLNPTGEISGALLSRLQEASTSKPITLNAETIRELQAKLSTMGFDTKGIDGKLGSRTTAAIRRFQAYKGVSENGEITAELMELIDETLLNPPRTKATLTNNQIVNLQRSLNALGYDVGVPDGKIGPRTRRGIQGFLEAEDMNPDTEINRLLLSVLLARAAPSVDDIERTGGVSSTPSGRVATRDSEVGTTEVSGSIRFHRSSGQLVGCSIAGVQVSAEWCSTFTHVGNSNDCKLSVRSNGDPIYIRCR